ncbi:hypothetical protein HKBW3S42_00802 [Candidatus Hakubella thermalkaliphila]|uniref:Uncharacterized protein n=1 Tax=Candidatus Hakubella thermalkaliphila TaxID=2754717 RepID=A0A6V8PJP7_9ACTN|nr:hypothetical protein HKBW3S42_00802 [Candidatus Hakubella thermalkaliphila]
MQSLNPGKGIFIVGHQRSIIISHNTSNQGIGIVDKLAFSFQSSVNLAGYPGGLIGRIQDYRCSEEFLEKGFFLKFAADKNPFKKFAEGKPGSANAICLGKGFDLSLNTLISSEVFNKNIGIQTIDQSLTSARPKPSRSFMILP